MSTAASEQKSMFKTYVHPVIVIILMLIGNFVPVIEPLTRMGMQVIFIFIGMIWGWSTCGMLWPSLLGVIMLGFTEYAETPEAALGLMLTNTTFVASLVAFVLFAYISDSGLMDVMARWVVTRKFAAGKPWTFMIFLFFALAVLSPFVGNPIVLILIGFSFVSPILKQMGYTKDEAFPTYMMLGISLCGLFSVWASFMPGSIYTRGILSTAVGQPVTSLQYTMCITVPLVLSLILFILTGKFIARVDTKKFIEGSKVLQEQRSEKISLNIEQKRGAVVLLVFIVGMVLPSVLPQTWAITAFLSRAGIVGVCVITTVALLILTKKDGKTLGDFKQMMQGMSWDMLMLMGGIMVIATALISEGTGMVAFCSGFMIPILSKTSLLGFVVIVCVLMCVISQFSMNMVLQMVFAPILAPVLMQAGYNPMIAVMAVYFGTQWAYLAPSGSMMAALVFGNTEWVSKKQLYKVCVPWIILSFIMSVIVSYTFPDIFCSNLTPN